MRPEQPHGCFTNFVSPISNVISSSVITTDTSISASSTNDVYQIDTSSVTGGGSAITITLPNITSLPNGNRAILYFTDVGGDVATNNVTIVGSASQPVAGNVAGVIMNTNYSTYTIMANYSSTPRSWILL